ncbi:immunoglobulin-like protein involved in spore germination [Neobacillus bataviensis]|uniref:Immunoglobulin-like protein involved in spore germination n=1 Tax=Neobacillus bataviensis TaxID=220685 RepID=A0A561CYT8_9BACI|nr:Gmad2 immunoglobulin-like domain-containing protein [Neobacillus bataviensis]TWD96396.1 immunoglobulin-like protein involved in spore germination [Neobacillus bataviensis]
MKKIAYLLAGPIIIFGLVACNHQQDETTNQDSPTSHAHDGSVNQDQPTPPVEGGTIAQGQPSTPVEEGTTDQDQAQPTSPAPEQKVYQNNVFKDVVVTESEDKIVVTGKAQVFEGVFQYVLYDGEKMLIQNHYQTDGAPAWGEFELTFEKKLVSSNEVKLELFVFSAKDGSKENILEIPFPKPK